MIEPFLENDSSGITTSLNKCKQLGKVIKARRTPTWPAIPTTDLPPKELTDTLIDIYLRTIERVWRVVHIPTFMRDYEALWISETTPDLSFVIQLKLMCAIGAAMYDDRFSLRVSAIQWVHEAQTWISEPERKARLNIKFLQINILHLFARETVGVDGRLIWISAGELVRTAVSMGLHRDPSHLPRRNFFIAEMRRRLWNTILEMTVQTSMESGGPPLFSLDDFDTHPPGNFDDEQIMIEDPVPKPEDTYTQTSTALALRKTLVLRLIIAKSLNGIGPHAPYDEVLRIDSELRKMYRGIRQTIQGYRNGAVPSKFETSVLDFLVCRNLLALHAPYLGPGHDMAYAFSRKVIVETCLKIWCSAYPASSVLTTSSRTDVVPDDFVRLTQCGSGPFRVIATQACFLIAAELNIQLHEQDSLGPAFLRRDLLAVLEEFKCWQLECIKNGEVNTKGLLFLNIVIAQIDGIMRGVPREQFPEMLAHAAEETERRCVGILEEKVGQSQDEIQMALDGIGKTPEDNLPDLIGNWDFVMPETELLFGTADSVYWMDGMIP
ncbi:uncharacterized protein N7459_000873 [Penicillium hispanicum]|uniref:uncharacterized protein n=1 Tax=Penicillium hispanicum TaxID=1080232 RepID=UPI0025404C73|nr:uncharacterized protein N7459_000873 [Penicillium hispanicum]KAJ5594665.1 hypothetical protein N7459_000873 [Penicillium hispanicum]